MANKNLLSIVVPVCNEAAILEKTLRQIQHYVKMTDLAHEIVFVDDGSSDGTWSIIRDLSIRNPEVRGIKLSRNFGKEAAITTGLEFASGDAVIVMDADGQHPAALVPVMVRLWQDGKADVIEAVKEDRGDKKFSSAIGAKFFYWLMKNLTALRLKNSSDYKLLDRKVVDAHNRLPETSRFFRGIVSWLGFTKIQIPFSVEERTTGKSRWSLLKLIKLAIDASTAFSSVPLHLVTIIGMLTFMVSIILGIQTLYTKFSGEAVSGFATVILLLLFIGSALMLSLGIIGIYVSRIFEEVKNRPKFIVDDSVGFKDSRKT